MSRQVFHVLHENPARCIKLDTTTKRVTFVKKLYFHVRLYSSNIKERLQRLTRKKDDSTVSDHKKVNGNFESSLLTQMSTHQINNFKDCLLQTFTYFQHSHLDFQMPVLCSVEFIDIYMAFYCHTQTSCCVVMDATSRKHVTVFSFANFNRFCVVAVNGGQWIEFYLTISSCNRKVLKLFRNSILHSSNQIKAANHPQKNSREKRIGAGRVG